MGSRQPRGYGTLSVEGKNKLAHRQAYELVNGSIPEGMNVCHSCDNRPCVNPAHLWIGTQKDNMHDCSVKGRMKGRRQGYLPIEKRALLSAKLTPADILAIRRRAAAGESRQSLAIAFGVIRNNIYSIVNRVTWKHIAEE
jgi:hypothetical protein